MSTAAVYRFIAAIESDPALEMVVRHTWGSEAIARMASERGFQFSPEELQPAVSLMAFLQDLRRMPDLQEVIGEAADGEAVVRVARERGYVFSTDDLSHLNAGQEHAELGDEALGAIVGGLAAGERGHDRFGTRLTRSLGDAPLLPGGEALSEAVANRKQW